MEKKYTNTHEIIIEEKKNSLERCYVQVPNTADSHRLSVIKIADRGGVSNLLKKIFLPENYPHSVSKDYLSYQIWDTAQAFCSAVSGTLATQEVLRGVGVGDENATALAATIMWVLKDGCGQIGRILFASTHGKYLDAYSKKWRLFADILNNAAMCIEIALPHFKLYSTFALCTSTVMKAIVGVAGGATRVAMTQHHAVSGNLADVAAKDAAQEQAVNLIASLVSLAIISCFGSSLVIFMLMMVLHVTFNYLAVRAVCLRTLNEPRFLLVIDKYIRQQIIATPCAINKIEPIIFYQLGRCIFDLKICGFRINLGSSVYDVGTLDAEHITHLRDAYSARPYILAPAMKRRTIHVLIKKDATTDDILCSYFHSVLLAFAISAIVDHPSDKCNAPDPPQFALVCAALHATDWVRKEARNTKHASSPYIPSWGIVDYINGVVAKEWPALRNGLRQTGWDVTTHHLVTDQWRITHAPPPSSDPSNEQDLKEGLETLRQRKPKLSENKD